MKKSQLHNPFVPGKDFKRLKEERKAFKRKLKEQKLMKHIEKEKVEKAAAAMKVEEEKKEEQQRKEKGRSYTVSIALPGSILDNAQSRELRTYLAGQIARAAVVFNVDEIIIFDETGSGANSTDGAFDGVGKKGQCNVTMARILQYLECPQYLRKAFFPQHSDLKYAGLLNPLDCPHHVRADVSLAYREGVVMDVPIGHKAGSKVDVGLRRPATVDRALTPGLRVTVKMPGGEYASHEKGKLPCTVVSPSEPRERLSLYWGYSVRLARSLGAVFTEGPHAGGYDRLVGTSERGEHVDGIDMPPFKHLLVVFGGVQGLEASLDADQDLTMDNPGLLFHHYLNVCPAQGSHTIRTEEAVLITLSALRPKIAAAQSKT